MMKLMVCELLINILVSFIIQITANVYLNYKWNKNTSMYITFIHQLNKIDMNYLWELIFTIKLSFMVFIREMGCNINEQSKIT